MQIYGFFRGGGLELSGYLLTAGTLDFIAKKDYLNNYRRSRINSTILDPPAGT